jgi:parallel beta-helix repeat protein
MIDDTGDEGVDCMSSDFMTFDDIIVNDVGGTGIYLESCTNGTLTNSVSRWTGSDGIYLWNCPNWTVTDNLVENTNGNGIQLNFGDNYLLTRNYVNVVSDTGINVDTSDNANVIDNHVTMADSEGYVVTTCENITFAGNTADECWDGGSFDTSDNAVIEGNIFTNLIGRGMYINDMVNIIVRNNVLSGAGDIGMDIDWIETSTFDGNDLTGFGFWFYPTRSYTYYNNTVVNNTVNGNDIYYSLDAVGLDLTASDYAQFIIINGSHVDIHDGSFDHVTNPIMFILSDNCSVWDVTATNNLYAIYYDRTDDCTVYNVNVNGGGNHYGLYSRLSDNFNLTASVFTGSKGNPFSGVHFVSSNVISVTDCDFSHNWGGISSNNNDDLLIEDNTFSHNQWYGISVFGTGSQYVRVLNNEIYNSTYGIWHENADNVTISMNTVMYTTTWGIQVTGGSANAVNITFNDVTMNDDAIGVYAVSNAFVMNNTVLWNEGYGVRVQEPGSAEVYYNLIALNNPNGFDSRAGNFWDDGVDTGNWWDDYTPPGVYDVDGNTDDRYPMQFAPTEPIISQPQDIYYAEGSEDNEILWRAFDDSLSHWTVTIDGGDWASDTWNFDNVTVNVDGLAYGTYTVFITLWDIHDNFVNDTVIVHVFDDTPPVISNVPNMIAFVDATDQVLSWYVEDLNPDTYTVYLDDEIYATGTWANNTLEFNIDDIPEGEHVLVMEIADIDGNIAQDPVEINVILDDVNPIVDSPADITYEVGTTGNVIVWSVSDDYPATFIVFTNDSTIAQGDWAGARISVSVDGLAVGEYRFQLTVTDGSGNTAEDFVNVIVTAIVPEAPPPPPPIDLGFIGLVIATIGGMAVVIVVIVIFLKKRKPY